MAQPDYKPDAHVFDRALLLRSIIIIVISGIMTLLVFGRATAAFQQRLLANLIFTNGKGFFITSSYLKITAENDIVNYRKLRIIRVENISCEIFSC